MEKKDNQKTDNSRKILIFVTFFLFFVLVIFILNSGLDTFQDLIVSAVLLISVMIGIVKMTKYKSVINTDQTKQSENTNSGSKAISSHSDSSNVIGDDSTEPSVTPTSAKQSASLPKWIQNIKSSISKYTKPQQVMILGGTLIIIVIIIVFLVSLTDDGPNTTITGTWEHELGSVANENSWVMTTTMWNVVVSDGGFLYMNVNEDGTFNLTYNNTVVSQGTWEESDNGYTFLYRDIDEILSSVSYEYSLKGSKLYLGINDYYTKVLSD